MTDAPNIEPTRMIEACNARHAVIIAACQLGYREASRAGEVWLVRAIGRTTHAGNIGYLVDYLETLAWLLENDVIDESDIESVAKRAAALRTAAQQALEAAESLVREELASHAASEVP